MLSVIALGLRVVMASSHAHDPQQDPKTITANLLICGAVVFGLSVSLANQQRVGSAPPEIGFSSFAGAFAIVTCLVGAAGLWVDSLPGIVTMVMDGIAAVVYLVGGIRFELYRNQRR
ncbi:uncharacterized protein PG986_013702 [Apiospora aurea]|uniref:MARVEL domain-containing protein n=1 Tax=Apiospora aurea TaxID=335848 RepID=A0ABR1PXC6_9PEZI